MLDSFAGGYGKALLDLLNFLDTYSDTLIHWKILSRKDIHRLRKILREWFDKRHDILEHPDEITFKWNDEQERMIICRKEN